MQFCDLWTMAVAVHVVAGIPVAAGIPVNGSVPVVAVPSVAAGLPVFVGIPVIDSDPIVAGLPVDWQTLQKREALHTVYFVNFGCPVHFSGVPRGSLLKEPHYRALKLT